MTEYIIFGRSTCPWTQKAIELADELKYIFTYVEVPSVPSESMGIPFKDIAKEKNLKTVPCIFEVTCIGGFTEFEKNVDKKIT